MAKTIVGLYDDHNTMESVADALKEAGFDRSDIHTASHGKKWSSIFGGDNLADDLSERGVPEDEAMLYAEGVRRGGSLIFMRVQDDKAQTAASIMNRFSPVDLERRRTAWTERGFSGYDRKAQPFTAEEAKTERARYTTEQEEHVPVAEEELKVGKRQVNRGGVRVHTHVERQPVEENVRVRDEKVEVERRNMDRPMRAGEEAFQEKTIEMSETDEEVVAEKETHVTGEVVVKKGAEEHTETVRDTVRKTDVDVERTGGQQTLGRFEDVRDTFRTHCDTNFDRDFTFYEPAYRHGFTYGLDENYRDREYTQVEPEMRRTYEERHGKGSFEQVKEAIRHAYNYARTGTRTRAAY